jgi:hypothetical protein
MSLEQGARGNNNNLLEDCGHCLHVTAKCQRHISKGGQEMGQLAPRGSALGPSAAGGKPNLIGK